MCGTFLVRSGILNSVHTFANDPERGLFILIFLFSLIFLSIFIFFSFHKNEDKNKINFFWLSKDTSILINNWFMMYFLSVILIGTIYPIFLDVISSEKISVGPPFYHKLIIPFLIPFLFLMAIGPKLKWIKSNFLKKKSQFLYLIISMFISIFVLKNLDVGFLINTILLTSAFYLLFVSLQDFIKKRYNNLAQSTSHLGFSLLILSILLNNFFSSEVITNLKIGEIYENNKIKINFEKIYEKNEQNFKSIVGQFNVQNSKGEFEILNPELRIYNMPNIITSEADIKMNLFEDKFMTMNLVQNQEIFNIRYQVKPFMLWIWISVIMISLGGFINLFKKNEK